MEDFNKILELMIKNKDSISTFVKIYEETFKKFPSAELVEDYKKKINYRERTEEDLEEDDYDESYSYEEEYEESYDEDIEEDDEEIVEDNIEENDD